MICPEGLLIIDDSIEPRKYRKSNSMITLHYDHCTGKSIKGVNFMNAFYYSPKHDMGIPIGVEFVTKDVEFKDDKGDIKKKSGRAKNEMIRSIAKYANYNGGTFYLASSDLNLDYPSLTTIYQKRWKVEGLFRSIKNNTAFAKAPTKTLKTQLAYFTASMIAFCILERLKVRNNKNQYAMKSQIWLAATKTAWKEPDRLSTNKTKFNKIAA